MSHATMCRLPQLLQYFRVGPNATYAELRQAYVHHVKQVHPDLTSDASASQFRMLQQNYEEATRLLRQNASEASAASSQPPWANVTQPQWSSAARKAQERTWEPPRTQKPNGVPTVGLPAGTVYVATSGVFAFAAAAFVLSQPEQPSPTVARSNLPQRARAANATGEVLEPGRWPALQSGPWCVTVARAADQKKASESPDFGPFRRKASPIWQQKLEQRSPNQPVSKSEDAGFGNLFVKEIQGNEGMLPVHAAAADGDTWWLEVCGANAQCRGTLHARDSTDDTPLHHAAKNGQTLACHTLLRLGADPGVKNVQDFLPEDMAMSGGHGNISEHLQKVRETGNGADGQLHPDGFGILAEPPLGVIFTGLQTSERERRAVNMAAGCLISGHLPVSRQTYKAQDVASRIINVVRGSLQNTEFAFEDLVPPAPACGTGIWQMLQYDGAELRGLLLYEPPGSVSRDAPGHWVAIRRLPEIPGTSVESFFRLDPVRGPFQISATELVALLGRYRAWRVVRKSASSSDMVNS